MCRSAVRQADVFVLIAGFRYGTLVPDDLDQRSYCELEFDEASKAGLPRLVFLVSEQAEGPAALFRDTALGARQESFRTKLRNGGFVAREVHSADNLDSEVLAALYALPRSAQASAAEQVRPTDPRTAVGYFPAGPGALQDALGPAFAILVLTVPEEVDAARRLIDEGRHADAVAVVDRAVRGLRARRLERGSIGDANLVTEFIAGLRQWARKQRGVVLAQLSAELLAARGRTEACAVDAVKAVKVEVESIVADLEPHTPTSRVVRPDQLRELYQELGERAARRVTERMAKHFSKSAHAVFAESTGAIAMLPEQYRGVVSQFAENKGRADIAAIPSTSWMVAIPANLVAGMLAESLDKADLADLRSNVHVRSFSEIFAQVEASGTFQGLFAKLVAAIVQLVVEILRDPRSSISPERREATAKARLTAELMARLDDGDVLEALRTSAQHIDVELDRHAEAARKEIDEVIEQLESREFVRGYEDRLAALDGALEDAATAVERVRSEIRIGSGTKS